MELRYWQERGIRLWDLAFAILLKISSDIVSANLLQMSLDS